MRNFLLALIRLLYQNDVIEIRQAQARLEVLPTDPSELGLELVYIVDLIMRYRTKVLTNLK